MELRDLLDILDGYETIDLAISVAKSDKTEVLEVKGNKRSLLKMVKDEYLDNLKIVHAYTEFEATHDKDDYQDKTKIVVVCEKDKMNELRKISEDEKNENEKAKIVEASSNDDVSYPYPTCNAKYATNLLGVTVSTMNQWIRSGKIKASTEVGEKNRLVYKITLKGLTNFLNNKKYMKKCKERVADGSAKPILNV